MKSIAIMVIASGILLTGQNGYSQIPGLPPLIGIGNRLDAGTSDVNKFVVDIKKVNIGDSIEVCEKIIGKAPGITKDTTNGKTRYFMVYSLVDKTKKNNIGMSELAGSAQLVFNDEKKLISISVNKCQMMNGVLETGEVYKKGSFK